MHSPAAASPPTAKAAKPSASPPDDTEERLCWSAGEHIVVGVDEVGRGAWAGPMTVGAVVMSPSLPTAPEGIRDSKQLSPTKRAQLFTEIDVWCADWSTGDATAAECDELGMSAALQLATRRALDKLHITPDRVLVDGRWNFVDWLPSRAIVKGDQRCVSIAAASIVAKVARDTLMTNLSSRFPPYGFDRNKGYSAPVHQTALSEYGPCALHRTSWSFMERVPLATPLPLAYPLPATTPLPLATPLPAR